MKYTLTPWFAVKNFNGGWTVKSIHAAKNDADVTDTYCDEIYLSEADARHIVKCVNSHDELLAALKEIASMQDQAFASATARAAIARAEPNETKIPPVHFKESIEETLAKKARAE